jgi:hypothetical protein
MGGEDGLMTQYQDWLFPFGICSYNFSSESWYIATPFQYPFVWFLDIIAIILSIIAITWVILGLVHTAVLMRIHENHEHAKQAIAAVFILLILQLIVPLTVIPLLYGDVGSSVKFIIPLPIPFLVAILLLKRSGVTLMPVNNLREP